MYPCTQLTFLIAIGVQSLNTPISQGGKDAILGFALFENHHKFSLCYHALSLTAFSRGSKTRTEIPKFNALFTDADDIQAKMFYFRLSQKLVYCLIDYHNGFVSCKTFSKDPNDYTGVYYKVPRDLRYWPTISMAPNNKDIWMSGGLGVKIDLNSRRSKSLVVHKMVTLIR